MDRVELVCDTYRLIPSHFPPIQIFENLLDPDELEVAYALEGITNDRVRDQAGDISLVVSEDRITGYGSTPIMAAFTHIGVESRFTKGRYGVYYAGLNLATALAESKFSRARLLSATDEAPQILMMRCYKCAVDGTVVDLRNNPQVHSPDSFADAQAAAEKLREQNEMGILYNSVRHPGGECIAALRPSLMKAPAIQSGHYQFHWNGSEITTVLAVNLVE
ncbi:RES family NAD+ phosphorylase [Dasania marina]|uniref:RES family NAD+ phosphorylase n=1 Tax=Dasania marina TaxID=471499 RepID=UPI00035DE42F|nr:RES family NAD+ phosphorylase [Dasania marina]